MGNKNEDNVLIQKKKKKKKEHHFLCFVGEEAIRRKMKSIDILDYVLMDQEMEIEELMIIKEQQQCLNANNSINDNNLTNNNNNKYQKLIHENCSLDLSIHDSNLQYYKMLK